MIWKVTLIRLAALLLGCFRVAAPLFAQPDQQVRVVEVIWGFDGRVVQGQFVPLSVLIDNLSDQPVEGNAQLHAISGMVNQVGGTVTQPFFLGPNSRRWVQFYPYIFAQMTSWRFSLVTEDEHFRFDPIDQPRAVFDSNQPAGESEQSMPAVILDPPGMATRSPTTIKHMPSEIFPPYATATSGLFALFLDHVPDWETPRQESLLSWLKSGGRLHLLRDQNNQMLRFSGVLSPLNEPFPEFSVGSGTVTRHDVQRADLTNQIVAPAVTPPQLLPEDLEEIASFNSTKTSSWSENLVDDDELFSKLRGLTQPDHAWWLIFLLSLCYVGLIFPGCWILSKQRTIHYLATYGAIAGLAAVFSMLFLFIGQRGYGESTALHTLAIARAEDDTHWSLLEFDTLFVTSGDNYQIEDNDHQTLMFSGATDEPVAAALSSGNSASFLCRIPPFSSQALISRRRLTTDSWDLSIDSFSEVGTQLAQLTMSFNEHFPTSDDAEYYVMHGRTVHQLSVDSSRRKLMLGTTREILRNFCQSPDAFDANTIKTPGLFGPMSASAEETDDESETGQFRKLMRSVVGRSLADDFASDAARFRLPAGKVRLLVYAPVPPSLEIPVSASARRGGRILFVRDLPLQLTNPGPPSDSPMP